MTRRAGKPKNMPVQRKPKRLGKPERQASTEEVEASVEEAKELVQGVNEQSEASGIYKIGKTRKG